MTLKKLPKNLQEIDITFLSEEQLHTTQKPFMPKELKTMTHVWRRKDGIRKPQEAPYSGPHKVIYREEKHFIIETLADDEQTVSFERLKPAKFTHVHNSNKNNKSEHN